MLGEEESEDSSRVVFLSDIHSNLEALHSVLSETRALPKYCLGDIVGYGASPNEVVELLRGSNVRCVLGNHDYAAVTRDLHGFDSQAAVTIAWTADRLTRENFAFVAGLPRQRIVTIGGGRFYLAHGSPDDQLWEYVDPSTHRDLFEYYLERLSVRAIGLGHTHVPYISTCGKGVVFNPGSVGQSRTGDSQASYAIVEVERGKPVAVEQRRVTYDIELAAQKILAAGLPEALGRRLFTGY